MNTDKFTPLMQDIVEYAAAARRASAVRSKIVIICATITERGEEKVVSFEVAGAGSTPEQITAMLTAALMESVTGKSEHLKTAAN